MNLIRKNIPVHITILILSISLLTFCKKYEEGPSFTLLTKRARITGEWKVKSLTFNSRDSTEWYMTLHGSEYTWTMNRDGTYNETGNVGDAGLWRLTDNKERITFSSSISQKEYSFQILRLTNHEMWLEDFNPVIMGTWVLKLQK